MLCFPWFRNDACSRLMVHLFTNRFCAHSSKMPINHVDKSAMKCFTAAVHNPQIQRNKWGISIFWGYLSSWSGTELKTERRSFKLLFFWNSVEACREYLLHMHEWTAFNACMADHRFCYCGWHWNSSLPTNCLIISSEWRLKPNLILSH